jgi:hypothetical protein
MFNNPAANWYHSNQYNAQAACEHGGGVVRHEHWCVPCDPMVRCAHGVVLDADKLTFTDHLILHALWVWGKTSCQRTCPASCWVVIIVRLSLPCLPLAPE